MLIRRTLLALLVVSLGSKGFCQVSTLEIHGEARILVVPDIGILKVQIEHLDLSMSESIVELNSKTKQLTDQIKTLGFKKENLQTSNFEVVENSFYRGGQKIDSGYISRQDLLLTFDLQDDKIKEILALLSDSSQDFVLSFDFEISSNRKSELKEELIKTAVEDAFDTAEKIALHSRHKINRLIRISDNAPQKFFEGLMFEEEFAVGYGDYQKQILGFQPKKIEMTKKLNIVFEIEPKD